MQILIPNFSPINGPSPWRLPADNYDDNSDCQKRTMGKGFQNPRGSHRKMKWFLSIRTIWDALTMPTVCRMIHFEINFKAFS